MSRAYRAERAEVARCATPESAARNKQGRDLTELSLHQSNVTCRSTIGTEQRGRSRTGTDDVLRQAVEAHEVPGVVAMAATDKGAFGT